MLITEQIFDISPYSWLAVLTAVLCGTVIGFERQYRGKPVGIRTSSLIVVGTYIFVAAADSVSVEMSDPSRIIGQVITGVGFLGAGVMLAKDGAVVGVTSAATIWVLAAIGVIVAKGTFGAAILMSFVVVAILVGVDLLESYSQRLTKGVHNQYQSWKKDPSKIQFVRRKWGKKSNRPKE
ncbi:MgtC/SapB family protein [Psychrosphaera sp. 1_MG-2023]|uniref:MgtC/SapB family protein n=1 Tax=Psychrosphaera sp. 1_MG-2023 TaxID=3062643 RepID=UPI0026E248AA|nr:MgtC/SapB family protein [Psychrosphaera sp. 1_MG-2023]MDO6719277.1 MgtC/SapB family protein [Psychrosphaera sp. 1_MG-2023]